MDPNKDMCIEIKLGKSESSNDKKLAVNRKCPSDEPIVPDPLDVLPEHEPLHEDVGRLLEQVRRLQYLVQGCWKTRKRFHWDPGRQIATLLLKHLFSYNY